MSSGLVERELVVADVETGATARLGFDGVTGLAWSPDGERLAISKALEGPYLIDADGAGPPRRLEPEEGRVHDWSSAGVLVLQKDFDLWTLDLEHGGEARLFVDGPSREMHAAFSPDARFLAYGSDVSGREEVYVRPYPGPEPVTPVSRDGGARPVWSRDGRRLFYRSGTDNRTKMMAVDVSTAEGTFRPGAVRELFDQPYLGTAPMRSYDVAPDGRFLMAEDWKPPPQPVTRLHVALNWLEQVERLVPHDGSKPSKRR